MYSCDDASSNVLSDDDNYMLVTSLVIRISADLSSCTRRQVIISCKAKLWTMESLARDSRYVTVTKHMFCV